MVKVKHEDKSKCFSGEYVGEDDYNYIVKDSEGRERHLNKEVFTIDRGAKNATRKKTV